MHAIDTKVISYKYDKNMNEHQYLVINNENLPVLHIVSNEVCDIVTKCFFS